MNPTSVIAWLILIALATVLVMTVQKIETAHSRNRISMKDFSHFTLGALAIFFLGALAPIWVILVNLNV